MNRGAVSTLVQAGEREENDLLDPEVDDGEDGDLELFGEDDDHLKGRFEIDMGGDDALKGRFTAEHCDMSDWVWWL